MPRPRDLRAYLWDMRDAADTITRFTQGRTRGDYTSDAMLRSAVERQLGIIGEAMNRALAQFPQVEARIPECHQIVSLRHHLVHGYETISNDEIWAALEADLPRLRSEVDTWLRELDPDLR